MRNYAKQSQFKNNQMNITVFTTMDYENLQIGRCGKTKPNKANSKRNPVKMGHHGKL